MKQTDNFKTSNAEMVTISRAEYEVFQDQKQQLRKRIIMRTLTK